MPGAAVDCESLPETATAPSGVAAVAVEPTGLCEVVVLATLVVDAVVSVDVLGAGSVAAQPAKIRASPRATIARFDFPNDMGNPNRLQDKWPVRRRLKRRSLGTRVSYPESVRVFRHSARCSSRSVSTTSAKYVKACCECCTLPR